MKRPLATAWSQASPRSISGRSTVISPLRTDAVQISDCSRKSAPSKIASAMPSSWTCAPLSCLFWFRLFSMMTETALSAPIRFGSSVQPPQPGTRPRKTSGRENAGRAADTVR
ncbi:hypothetical protein STENM36S_01129 [Streptomyces tendae]